MTISLQSSSKKLSILAERFVPDFVKEEHPLFVDFIGGYFKFIEKEYISQDTIKIVNTTEISDDSIAIAFACKQTHISDDYNHPTGLNGSEYWEFKDYITAWDDNIPDWDAGVTYHPTSYGIYRMITNMLEETDIDKNMIDDYLAEYKKQYIPNIPLREDLTKEDVKLILKNIREFYKAKGTEASYKFLFNVVFEDDIDFYYPKVDILRASDGRWNDTSYIVVDKKGQELEKFYDQEIVGVISGARAFVSNDKTRLIEEDNNILYLKSISGDFEFGEGIVIRNLEIDDIDPDEMKETEVDNATIISKKNKWGVRQNNLRQKNARAYSAHGYSLDRSGDLMVIGAPSEEEIRHDEETTQHIQNNDDPLYVIGTANETEFKTTDQAGNYVDTGSVKVYDVLKIESGLGGGNQYFNVVSIYDPTCSETNLDGSVINDSETCNNVGGDWIYSFEVDKSIDETTGAPVTVNKVLNIESTDGYINAGAVYLYRFNGSEWIEDDTNKTYDYATDTWVDNENTGRLQLPIDFDYYHEWNNTIVSKTYNKYDNEHFGFGVSLLDKTESDGSMSWLAIGAPGNIYQDVMDNSSVGHVYIYSKREEDAGWRLQQVLDPDYIIGEQQYGFGYSLKLAYDGTAGTTGGKIRLAIGAPYSNAVGYEEATMKEQAGSVHLYYLDTTTQHHEYTIPAGTSSFTTDFDIDSTSILTIHMDDVLVNPSDITYDYANDTITLANASGGEQVIVQDGKFYYDTAVAGNAPINPARSIEKAMFGASVDIRENILLVGEPKGIGDNDYQTYFTSLTNWENDPTTYKKPEDFGIGSVHIYWKEDDVHEWTNINRLGPANITNNDTILNSKFGVSVMMTENYMMIGSPNQETPSSVNGGVVYAYDNYKVENGVFKYSIVTKLYAEWDKKTPGFGSALYIFESPVDDDGNKFDVDKLAVAAPTESNKGSVYVFNRVRNTWKRVYIVDNPNPDHNHFAGATNLDNLEKICTGKTIHIEDDYLFAGHPKYSKNTGIVYPFKNIGSKQLVLNKENWRISQDLIQKEDSVSFEEFGSYVNILQANDVNNFEDDIAFVGEAGTKLGHIDRISTVHILKKSGALWKLHSKIFPSHYVTNPKKTQFGSAISSYDDVVVIGAPNEDGSLEKSGKAYIYQTSDKGETWELQRTLQSPNINAKIEGQFGYSVIISNDYIFIGAPNEDVEIEGSVKNSGVVYLFKKVGNSWADGYLMERIWVPVLDHISDLKFGYTISFNQTTKELAIGAPNANVRSEVIGGTGTFELTSGVGKVFIYRENSNGYWSQKSSPSDTDVNSYEYDITTESPIQGAKFGSSICMCGSGDTIAIGSPNETYGTYDNCGVVHTLIKNANGKWQRSETTDTKIDIINTNILTLDPSDLDYENDKKQADIFLKDPGENDDIYFNIYSGKILGIKEVTTIQTNESFDQLTCHHYAGTWSGAATGCQFTGSYCSDYDYDGSCSTGTYCDDWETNGICSDGESTDRSTCESFPNYGVWQANHYDKITCEYDGRNWIETHTTATNCVANGGEWYATHTSRSSCEQISGNTWTQGSCETPTWALSGTNDIGGKCYVDNGGDVDTWTTDDTLTTALSCDNAGHTWIFNIKQSHWDGSQNECEIEQDVTEMFSIRSSSESEKDVSWLGTETQSQELLGLGANIEYYFAHESGQVNYRVITSNEKTTADEFGASVKISDKYLIVGSPGYNGSTSSYGDTRRNWRRRSTKKYKYQSTVVENAGAVYIFDLAKIVPTQLEKIEAEFYDRNERFGENLSAYGDSILATSKGYKVRRGRLTGIENNKYEEDSGIIKERGFWYTTDGFLDSKKVMQDNFIYQEFSYMIDSDQQISEYRSIVKDNVHPVGMQLIGRYNLGSTINVGALFDVSLDYELNMTPSASGGYINPQTFHSLCRDWTVVFDVVLGRFTMQQLPPGVPKVNIKISELMHEKIASCSGDDVSLNLPEVVAPTWTPQTTYNIDDVVKATSHQLNHVFAINRKENKITLIDHQPEIIDARVTLQTTTIDPDYMEYVHYSPENFVWSGNSDSCIDNTGTDVWNNPDYQDKGLCEAAGYTWAYGEDSIAMYGDIQSDSYIKVYVDGILQSPVSCYNSNNVDITNTQVNGIDQNYRAGCEGQGNTWRGYVIDEQGNNIDFIGINDGAEVSIEHYKLVTGMPISGWSLPTFNKYSSTNGEVQLDFDLTNDSNIEVYADGVYQSPEKCVYDYDNNKITINSLEDYTSVIVIDLTDFVILKPTIDYFDFDGSSSLVPSVNLFNQTIISIWIDGIFQSSSKTSLWRPNTTYQVDDVVGAPDDPTSAFVVEKIYDSGLSAQLDSHMPDFDQVEMGGFIQDGPVTPVFDEIGSAIIRYDRAIKIIWKRVPIVYNKYFRCIATNMIGDCSDTTIFDKSDCIDAGETWTEPTSHEGNSGTFEPIWKLGRNAQTWDNEVTWTCLSPTNAYDENIRPDEIVQIKTETNSFFPSDYPFIKGLVPIKTEDTTYTIELGECLVDLGGSEINKSNCLAASGSIGSWNYTTEQCDYILPIGVDSWSESVCNTYNGIWNKYAIKDTTINISEVASIDGITRYSLFDTKGRLWNSSIEYAIDDVVKYWDGANLEWAYYKARQINNKTISPIYNDLNVSLSEGQVYWTYLGNDETITTGFVFFMNATTCEPIEGFYNLLTDPFGRLTIKKWNPVGTIDYNTGIININNLRLSDYISANTSFIIKAIKED